MWPEERCQLLPHRTLQARRDLAQSLCAFQLLLLLVLMRASNEAGQRLPRTGRISESVSLFSVVLPHQLPLFVPFGLFFSALGLLQEAGRLLARRRDFK